MTYDELLKDFADIAHNGRKYEQNSAMIQRENNYKQLISQFKKDMAEYPVLVERYNKNIDKAKQLAEKLYIVHNTDVDSLISILTNGKIMCAEELKLIGYPYRKRVSAEYLKKNLNSYVYGALGPGDKLFGPIEIVFKREVEQSEGAVFIYKNHFLYTAKRFLNEQMNISKWRSFLAEKLSIEMEDVSGYPQNTAVCDRLEFYFPRSIDLKYVDKVICCNKEYYDEIMDQLEEEFRGSGKYKELIVLDKNSIGQGRQE